MPRHFWLIAGGVGVLLLLWLAFRSPSRPPVGIGGTLGAGGGLLDGLNNTVSGLRRLFSTIGGGSSSRPPATTTGDGAVFEATYV